MFKFSVQNFEDPKSSITMLPFCQTARNQKIDVPYVLTLHESNCFDLMTSILNFGPYSALYTRNKLVTKVLLSLIISIQI